MNLLSDQKTSLADFFSAISVPPQQIESPEEKAANPQHRRKGEVFEIAERGERRAGTCQHCYEAGANANAQRPRAPLHREVVAAVRKTYARADRQDQQCEA